MKAIIVCGTREPLGMDRRATVMNALDDCDFDVMIHGLCPEGVDHFADMVVRGFAASIAVIPMPAQWDQDGKKAGPIRNERMLNVLCNLREQGYEVAVLAFPGPKSLGTWDMVNKAKCAGVTVVVTKLGVGDVA